MCILRVKELTMKKGEERGEMKKEGTSKTSDTVESNSSSWFCTILKRGKNSFLVSTSRIINNFISQNFICITWLLWCKMMERNSFLIFDLFDHSTWTEKKLLILVSAHWSQFFASANLGEKFSGLGIREIVQPEVQTLNAKSGKKEEEGWKERTEWVTLWEWIDGRGKV